VVYSLSCRGDTLVVQVRDSVHLTSDLTPLYDLIRSHIAFRQTDFEICFPPGSFLYSGQLAVLLKCAERVREAEGRLAILDPTEELIDALAWIDPAHLIRIKCLQRSAVTAAAF